jgi:thiamine biosynthesis lipoprotein
MTATLAPHEPPRERFVEQVMGLPVTLALRGRHARTDASRAAWRAVMTELMRIDRLFSTYRPESPISQIGRGELTVADGPPELAEVLQLADAARRATDGAFDVWRTDDRGGRIFDPSGVVKGWALERAARALASLDQTGWCLSGGGDMVCWAGSADLPPWRIGIENPADPSLLVQVVELRDGGIATSGTAHRGQHIRDARDGRAPHGAASVTVIADSLTVADIEATSGFLMGQSAASWLSQRPVRSAIVVSSDGQILTV